MILFIQGRLPHYRHHLFQAMAETDDIVIVHSGPESRIAGSKYRQIILPVTNWGPFRIQRGLLKTLRAENPDNIIAMFDVRWLNTIRAMWRFDRRARWVWWGLDRGGNNLALKAKLWLAARDNPIVFYHDRILQEFRALGLAARKLFVVHNTFQVENAKPCYGHPTKNSFINVGTLDARKQNAVTIQVFKSILEETQKDLRLILIGDGTEEQPLSDLIEQEGLGDHVVLAGRIEDADVLEKYYQEAIASVSFGQAGLAVLQSMAFGVPFVTKENAISGGEKYNIENGINGILCEDDPEALKRALYKLIEDPEYARDLGKNAYEHYTQNASMENMAQGFLQALKYRENDRD